MTSFENLRVSGCLKFQQTLGKFVTWSVLKFNAQLADYNYVYYAILKFNAIIKFLKMKSEYIL